MARVSPRNQDATLSFSTPSTALATSIRRTGAPLRHATTRLSYSAALASCPLVRMDTDWAVPSMLPTGWLTLAAAIACCNPSMPMPRACSRPGSARMRTARFCEPKTLTWATPGSVDRRCASWVSAYSLTVVMGTVSEYMAI